MSELNDILERGKRERRSLSRLFGAFSLIILVLMLTAMGSIGIIQKVVTEYRNFRDISQIQMAMDRVRVAEVLLIRDHNLLDLDTLQQGLTSLKEKVREVVSRNRSLAEVLPHYRAYHTAVNELIALAPQYTEKHKALREAYFAIRTQILKYPMAHLGSEYRNPSKLAEIKAHQVLLSDLANAMADSSNYKLDVQALNALPEEIQAQLDQYLEQLDLKIANVSDSFHCQERHPCATLMADLAQYRQLAAEVAEIKIEFERATRRVLDRAEALSYTLYHSQEHRLQALKTSYDLVDLLMLLTVAFTLATGFLVLTLARSRRASVRVLNDLAYAVRQANAAAEAKSRFLATMSHEIRTPMNAIIGLTQLTLKEPLSDKLANWLQKVHQSAHGLLHILNDVLDVSKVEAGKMVLEHTAFDLHQVLKQVNALSDFSAREKGLTWQIQVGPTVPALLMGDPLRLGQVLQNLAHNAIKFTHQGSVTLTVNALAVRPDSTELAFSVTDTGIGIEQTQMDTLFQPFDQGDPATTRHFGGTGLGLSICHGIAEAMGGTISVTSEPGLGSCFTLRVPFTLAKSEPGQVHLRWQALSGKRVAWMAAPVTCPPDWREWLSQQGVELAFTDVPETADLQVFSDEQTLPANASNALLLQQRWQKREDGVPSLNLPISSLRLARALCRAFDSAEPCPPPQYDANALCGLPSGKRILVVEDNPINQELVLGLLTPLQWQIDLCKNGLEALEQVKRRVYDLILMDCHMPVMDGFEATRLIKAEGQCTAPIIALTAYVMPEEKARMWACGFDDAVDKPIQIQQLQGALTRWLGPAQAQPEPCTTPTVALPAIPGLDRDVALQNGGGQIDVVLRALLLFARQLEEFGQKVWPDSAGLGRALHTLKGVAGNLGANDLYWQCHHAEQNLTDEALTRLREQALELAKSIHHALPDEPGASSTAPAASVLTRSQLLAALRSGDTRALNWIGQFSARALGVSEARFQSVMAALDQFDFEQALALIEKPEND